MDLKAVRSQPERMGEMLLTLSRFMREIRRSAQPTIARVQGAAVGGGCGLMTVCDFSMTHVDSKVGYPEVDLGVCPAVVAPWLVRRIGSGRARQLLLAGGTISGRQGHEYGIVTHLADLDDLEPEAMTLAERLAQGGRHAMSVTKKWLNELDGSFEDAVLDKAAKISADVVQGEEAQARLTAFFEDRATG
jgi:methylglutaconyl-CoA hydratase